MNLFGRARTTSAAAAAAVEDHLPDLEPVKRSWVGEVVDRARRTHLGVHATALAAQLLTTLLPLALVLVAVLRHTTDSGVAYGTGPTGRWIRSVFDPAAAADLGRVFASSRHVAAATTGASLGLLVISVVGVPASFQRITELVWELPEAPLTRAFVRQLFWIGTLVAFIAVLSVVDTVILGAGGDVAVDLVVNCVLAVPYLLVTQRLVLGSRVGWRQLLPGSVAAGAGLLVFLTIALWGASATVTSSVAQFGPIGVAFAFQAFVLVVAHIVSVGILLGAVLSHRRTPRCHPDRQTGV